MDGICSRLFFSSSSSRGLKFSFTFSITLDYFSLPYLLRFLNCFFSCFFLHLLYLQHYLLLLIRVCSFTFFSFLRCDTHARFVPLFLTFCLIIFAGFCLLYFNLFVVKIIAFFTLIHFTCLLFLYKLFHLFLLFTSSGLVLWRNSLDFFLCSQFKQLFNLSISTNIEIMFVLFFALIL